VKLKKIELFMNNHKHYVKTQKAQEIIKVDANTLRRWANSNKIDTIRSPGGNRLYNISSLQRNEFKEQTKEDKKRIKYCYCRVSTAGQKSDLERQIKFMSEQFPYHQIITDIGSGINFKRKGLRTLLERAFKGDVEEIVVAYKDRLCRFGFDLLDWVFSTHDVKLLVLNSEISDPETELTRDLMSIIHVFSCKINGRRKYSTNKQRETQKTHTRCDNDEENKNTLE
jgi:predicted site-specific integrase-resolvase